MVSSTRTTPATHLSVIPKGLRTFKCDDQWAAAFARGETDRWYPKLQDVKAVLNPKGTLAPFPLFSRHPASALVLGNAVRNLDQAIRTENIQSAFHIKPDAGTKWEWVFDNGYLDAVANTTAASADLSTHLKSMFESLTDSGSLIILTLGFDAVVSNIVRYFRSETAGIHLIPFALPKERGLSHPVFLLVATKTETNTDQMMSIHNYAWNPKLPPTLERNLMGIFRVARDIRLQLYHQVHLNEYREGQLHFFDVVDDSRGEKQIAYQMTLYDRITDSKKVKNLKPTVAILVPLADQHHWLYKTGHGHQKLAERAGCLRILCVFLPDFGELTGEKIHPVQTVEKIKQELGSKLVEMSVDTKQSVLLMTQQEQFEDERIIVRRTESPYAGRILVFDAVVDKDDEELQDGEHEEAEGDSKALEASEFTRRTIIFECTPRAAQAEAWYRKVDGKIQMVYGHVCHSYHLMVLAAFLTTLNIEQTNRKGCVIGVGGGILSSMLKLVFGNRLALENVDIDSVVADIAKTDFMFNDSEMPIVVKDGIQYIKDKKGDKLDFVIVDINGAPSQDTDYSHGVTAPPEPFYAEEFLTGVKDAMQDDGIVLFNVVCQTDTGRHYLGSHLRKVFGNLCTFKLTKDYNEIVLATNKTLPSPAAIDTSIENLRTLFETKQSEFPALADLLENTPLYLGRHSRSAAACLPM